MNYMYDSDFLRSVIIDGFVYICSNNTFMAADIKDFKQTDSYTFANNIADDIYCYTGSDNEVVNSNY